MNIPTPSLSPIESTDTFIREYVKDSAAFVLCCEYRDEEGNHYTLCQNQEGQEWVEEQ